MIGLLLLACTAPKPVDDSGAGDSTPAVDSSPDSAAETGGESAAETGDDTAGDTGEDTGLVGDDGLLAWAGEADVADGWDGSESVVFVADVGLGDTLCEVWYPVTGIAPRDDCAECILAWDVVLGAPDVRIDTLCETAGQDAATIAAREGETRSYGIALDFLGHSNVLMLDDGGVWKAVTFVDWNGEAMTVSYQWEQAVISY